MAESKIQWHPGFYAGMELEFSAYRVTMQQEFQLTRGPLSIDLLMTFFNGYILAIYDRTLCVLCVFFDVH